MADRVFVGDRAANVDISPTFNTYSKVIIHISDDKAIEVGNNTGRTLELDNPFGTKKMAEDILRRLSGYQYQPYKADEALLNPAAEVGDTISVSSAYSMMFTRSRQFGRLMKANISAPCDEEINHEYTYESPQERKFTRVTGELSASIELTQESITAEVLRREAQGDEFSSRLKQTADSITSEVNRATEAEGNLSTSISQTADSITAEVTRATTAEGTLRSSIQQNATEIAAKVSQTGGDNSSFGWSLKSSEFGLYAGNNKVFWVNSSGANVQGRITATSGYIGDGTNGFSIGSTYIRNGMTGLSDTTNNGIYISTSGIALGAGKFKVFSDGSMRATSGVIGGFTINSTYLNYNGLNWGDTGKNGVYIGRSGIQLGENFKVSTSGYVTAKNLSITGGTININNGAFKVDSSGNLTANSGTFGGTSYAGKIEYGGTAGTLNGAGITSGSIGTGSGTALSAGAVGGIGGGINFNNMTQRSYTADWVVANHILCYSGGSISGTHYGSWNDDSSTHWVYWKSKSLANSVSVSLRANNGYYFQDTGGNIRYVTYGYSASSSLGFGDTINYLGY